MKKNDYNISKTNLLERNGHVKLNAKTLTLQDEKYFIFSRVCKTILPICCQIIECVTKRKMTFRNILKQVK